MPHVTANGISLYYELRGEGPPLALVEGIGYSSWMWFRQVESLSSRHRLLIYDNRDVGESEKTAAQYSIADAAADLAGLLDALGIDRTHLLGASWGGFVAQQFALDYPHRLDRLILACTTAGGPDMVPASPETLQGMVPDWSLPPDQRIRTAMALGFGPGFLEAHPDLIDAVVGLRLAAPVQPLEAYVRQGRAGAAFDASGRLRSISAPTLVLHGDQDRVVPIENGRLLAQRIPGAELAVFHGAGHLLFIEQAERFNRCVLDFLS